MKKEITSEGVKITDISAFSLSDTLDCGQCFRWEKTENDTWKGVVKGTICEIRQDDDGVTIFGIGEEEFLNIWFDYFDFDQNYDLLKKSFAENDILKEACEFAPGIRVLRQEPWEAYISFIISQNNNISRIKGIIERLCMTFGDEIEKGIYSFPSPERLAKEKKESFEKIGCGYRADYISSAAKEIYDGKLNLDGLKTVSIDEARKRLLNVHGIGPKVADCILLYGLGRTECCPADVWMKRVIATFGGKMPKCVIGYEGIAQQFLFHYARNFPEKFTFTKD